MYLYRRVFVMGRISDTRRCNLSRADNEIWSDCLDAALFLLLLLLLLLLSLLLTTTTAVVVVVVTVVVSLGDDIK